MEERESKHTVLLPARLTSRPRWELISRKNQTQGVGNHRARDDTAVGVSFHTRSGIVAPSLVNKMCKPQRSHPKRGYVFNYGA